MLVEHLLTYMYPCTSLNLVFICKAWFIGGVEASVRLHLFMWRRGCTCSVGGVEALGHFEAWRHLFILRHL